jgi:hypothetical protein
MKTLTILGLCVGLCGFGSAGVAAPCVSETFDVPLPGATNVVSHVTDVPSVQFPGFWQEGQIEGFAYQIFSNAEGVLQSAGGTQDWSITIACDRAAQTCDLTADGAPSDAALWVADTLGQCLMRADVVATDFTRPVEPEIVEPAPVIVTEAELPPCGAATVREATEVATMQRLLKRAGANPGPVDGLLGPRTFRAMAQFVDSPKWDTPIADVIAVLDAQLCAQGA